MIFLNSFQEIAQYFQFNEERTIRFSDRFTCLIWSSSSSLYYISINRNMKIKTNINFYLEWKVIKCNFKTHFPNSKSISFVEIEPKLLTYMHIKSRVWFYIENILCAKIAFTNKLLQRLLRKVNEHFKSDTSSIAEENTLLIFE